MSTLELHFPINAQDEVSPRPAGRSRRHRGRYAMVLVRPGECSVAYADDIASDEGLRDQCLGLMRVRRVLVEQLSLINDGVSTRAVNVLVLRLTFFKKSSTRSSETFAA